jgi:hypothetical protein
MAKGQQVGKAIDLPRALSPAMRRFSSRIHLNHWNFYLFFEKTFGIIRPTSFIGSIVFPNLNIAREG